MPTKVQNVHQLIYLFCDNEAYEKSLFDLDTSDQIPIFQDPSKNVSADDADMLPVSLDQKSKLVLVGDYGKRFRTQDDHQQLSLMPIIGTHHPANLLGLRRHITSNNNIVFASERVVNWINVDQLKLFDAANLSPVFVHLKNEQSKTDFTMRAILRFLSRLDVDVIELSRESDAINDLSSLVRTTIDKVPRMKTTNFTSSLKPIPQGLTVVDGNNNLDNHLFFGFVPTEDTTLPKNKDLKHHVTETLNKFNDNVGFMSSFHQIYNQRPTHDADSSFDLPWNTIDLQNDSDLMRMCAENGSDVSLKFWDNSLLDDEELKQCYKKSPRNKVIQLLKNIFQKEEDRKGIDNVIRHKCCKGITMEHKKRQEGILVYCLRFV